MKKESDTKLATFNETKTELENLKNQDQVKRNNELQDQINSIHNTFLKAVGVYEDLVSLDYKTKNDTTGIKKDFAQALSYLSENNYQKSIETIALVSDAISKEEEKIASTEIKQAVSVAQSNNAPESGFSKQTVNVDGIGSFLVSIVAADLSSTRVIADTASDTECSNNCPTLPLATFVSRNGAYAGVNGSYFCPQEYPSCSGKTNSFDLLVMNNKKTYFNSDNNVYSTNPAVIFGEGYIRFVSQVSQWGRDTSPNGVLSNYPLLVSGGQVVFGGNDDPKQGSKGGRSFVGNKGSTVYIGVVHSATVAESARVLATLGMGNALNLDDGGSTALWDGGYKVGPGRNLANVILFVKK